MILCVLVMLDVQSGGCWPWGYPDPPPPPPDKVVCDTWDSDCDCLSYATETNAKNGPHGFNPAYANPNESEASGSACGTSPVTPESPAVGTLVNGINLTDTGTGYYHYPGTEGFNDIDDWRTEALLWVIESGGRRFSDEYSGYRFGVGDLSLQNGGVFCWWESGIQKCHTCHQNGRDADIRYFHTDGAEEELDLTTQEGRDHYSVERSMDVLWALILAGEEDCGSRIVLIYVGTESRIQCPEGGCTTYELYQRADHNNHMHIQIADPDD